MVELHRKGSAPRVAEGADFSRHRFSREGGGGWPPILPFCCLFSVQLLEKSPYWCLGNGCLGA